jgi:hypothetical protein
MTVLLQRDEPTKDTDPAVWRREFRNIASKAQKMPVNRRL